jgi:hypothetical protein
MLADGPVYGRYSVQPRMNCYVQGYLVAPIHCPASTADSLKEAGVDELEQVVSMTIQEE